MKTIMTDQDALRREIIETALKMNALGINQGKSGNVSARIHLPPAPGSGARGAQGRIGRSADGGAGAAGGFIITPTGLPYDQVLPADLAFMPLAARDEHDFIGPRLPSSEWRFHRDIYAARPEAAAVVHTHGVYATTLACLGRGIPAFHYMVAVAGGIDIRCTPYATFGTQELSDHALVALRDRKACLLAHHGLIAVGPTLERALALAVEIEALARIYWQVLQIGEPATLPDAEMTRVLEKFKTYGQPGN
jgi:L-fuculose-phosphate aldolase